MARTRSIKPAFFKNEDLAELKPIERLLFIGLWTLADYKGCLEYRPKRIKAELFPYDDIDIDPTLTRLTPDHIQVYSVDGSTYIKIVNFEKHQNPHKKEKDAGSNIPDLTENSIIIQEDIKRPDLDPTQNGTSRALNLKPLTSNLNTLNLNTYTEVFEKVLGKKVLKVSGKRKVALLKFSKSYTPEQFESGLLKVKASDFLNGKSFCGFDWVINENNFLKIIEGNYDNNQGTVYEKTRNNTTNFTESGRRKSISQQLAEKLGATAEGFNC